MSLLYRVSLILISFCLLFILSCVTKPESDTINIHVRGTITYETTGTPADSAKVILYEYYNPRPVIGRERLIKLETYSGAFGFYEIKATIPVLPDGYKLVISVFQNGFVANGKSVEWSEDVQILNIQIFPIWSDSLTIH